MRTVKSADTLGMQTATTPGTATKISPGSGKIVAAITPAQPANFTVIRSAIFSQNKQTTNTTTGHIDNTIWHAKSLA